MYESINTDCNSYFGKTLHNLRNVTSTVISAAFKKPLSKKCSFNIVVVQLCNVYNKYFRIKFSVA